LRDYRCRKWVQGIEGNNKGMRDRNGKENGEERRMKYPKVEED